MTDYHRQTDNRRGRLRSFIFSEVYFSHVLGSLVFMVRAINVALVNNESRLENELLRMR